MRQEDHCVFKFSLGCMRSSRPPWTTDRVSLPPPTHTQDGRAERILCEIKGEPSSVEKLSSRVEGESWLWEWLSGVGDGRGGDSGWRLSNDSRAIKMFVRIVALQ